MKEKRIPVLCGQMLITAMSLTSVGLAIPRIADELRLTLAMRGSIVSAQFFGATIALVLGGIFCDIYGSAFITRIFMLVAAIVSLLFGAVWNFPSVIIAAFLLGAANLVLENSIMSAGLDLGEKSRVANSMIQTSFSVGAILVPLLFLACLQFGLWRPLYYAMALLFFVGFAVSKGKAQKKVQSESFAKKLMKYGSFFKKPSYLIGPCLVFLYVAAEVGLWSLAPTFFEAAENDPLPGIISTLLIWVMMLVGRIVGTMLIKKTTIMRILIPFGLCGVAAYCSILVFGGTVALVFTAIMGFLFAPFYALLTSMATEVSGDGSGAYLAFTMGMGTLGPALLGGVGGKLGQAFGSRFVILPSLIAFIILVILLVVFATANSRKNTGANPD